MDWSKWIKVVRHRLGLVGLALALIFISLPKFFSQPDIPPWFPIACYFTAMVVIMGGLWLAYTQNKVKGATKKDSSRQTTHGSSSPIVKNINGNVKIEIQGDNPKAKDKENE